MIASTLTLPKTAQAALLSVRNLAVEFRTRSGTVQALENISWVSTADAGGLLF